MTEKQAAGREVVSLTAKGIGDRIRPLLKEEHDLVLEQSGILHRERQLKNGDYVSITDTGTTRKNEYLVMIEAEKNGTRLEEYSWSKTEPQKANLDQAALIRINELVDIVEHGEVRDA